MNKILLHIIVLPKIILGDFSQFSDESSIRVSYKSDKRSTRNGGQLFNFNGFDGNNEIQITCFTQEEKKFFDFVKVKI